MTEKNPNLEEKQAIARLKQGDLSGMETLVKCYQVQAVYAAYLIVHDLKLAEDVVQTSFLHAAEKISQFDETRPFKAWFLKSVIHASIKAAKRQERFISLDDDNDDETSTAVHWLSDPNQDPDDVWLGNPGNPYNISIFARGGDNLNPAKNWLTRQEMVKLAESITGVHLVPESQSDPEYLTSVSEAEKLAGFSIKLPTQLPEGKNLDHIRFESEGSQRTVTLYYSDSNLELEIVETAGSENTLQTISKDHPEAFDPVTVHNQPALISQGYWDNNEWKKFEDGGDGSASVAWFEDGIQYLVSGFNEYPRAVWLAIAESLK